MGERVHILRARNWIYAYFCTPQAEEAWGKHVAEAVAKILRTKADSWFVGANIPGKARALLTSPDSAPVMRAKRAEVAANGYEGFLLQ
jgi:hypothetical protein